MTTVPTTMGPTDATIAVLATGPDLSGSSAPSAAADFLAAILQALAPGGPGAATAAWFAGHAMLFDMPRVYGVLIVISALMAAASTITLVT